MAAVRRYRLGQDRELAVAETLGLVVLSVHDRSGACAAGPLALRLDDVETVRSALFDVIEPGPDEARDW